MQLVRDLVDHENSLWLNYTAGAPVRKLTPEHEADLRAFYTAFSTFNRDVMDAYAGAKNAAGGGIGILNHCGGTDVPAPCPPVSRQRLPGTAVSRS